MKTTKNYASTLKELLCFSDTKFVVLSKAVGYDISYISKWCKNIKIPTNKNIGIINERASEIFSEEIIKQNKIQEFYKAFQISQQIDLEDSSDKDKLKSSIYDLLEAAYKKSEKDLSEKVEEKQEGSKIIVGKNDAAAFIRQLISTTLENSTTDIELICTMDICKTAANMNIDLIQEFKFKDIKVNAKVGFNMNEFEENPNFYLGKIYSILNKRWNVEFDFYDNKDMDKLNIIAIKDKFAITCSLDCDGLIEVATIITDEKIVNTIYDKAISKFRIGDILIRSTDVSSLEKGGYRTEFYSNDEFQFLSTRGFEFLLPSEVISDIVETAYAQGFGEDTAFLIRKLQITWEEMFEKRKINFIILKSALMKYIEEGEIFYTNIIYNLSVEQRKNHALKIVECMKKNSNIKIIILDDELLNYDSDFFRISAYANNKKVFLKKNLKNKLEDLPLFYTIINEKLVKYINQYLISIKDKDFCTEYDAEAVEHILEKYGAMYLRMIEAKEFNKKHIKN